MTLGLADRSNMQTPFFLRGHTPQGLEGPRSHCGVCSEAPRMIYVSVLNHIVNASTYLCVINGLRYLALLVFTQAVLSQVTLPCALKRHEALCCPALAILVPVMHQPPGGQDLVYKKHAVMLDLIKAFCENVQASRSLHFIVHERGGAVLCSTSGRLEEIVKSALECGLQPAVVNEVCKNSKEFFWRRPRHGSALQVQGVATHLVSQRLSFIVIAAVCIRSHTAPDCFKAPRPGPFPRYAANLRIMVSVIINQQVTSWHGRLAVLPHFAL